jgi:hypothetical protein
VQLWRIWTQRSIIIVFSWLKLLGKWQDIDQFLAELIQAGGRTLRSEINKAHESVRSILMELVELVRLIKMCLNET